MARVQFKAKLETIYNMDDTVAYTRLKVPALSSTHCDMPAFRSHKRFGSYANSDLFHGLLKRAVADLGVRDHIRMDQPLPQGVTVDASGFLHVVTFDL